MPFRLYTTKVFCKLQIIEGIMLVLPSVFLGVLQVNWGLSGFTGGIIAWLTNLFFIWYIDFRKPINVNGRHIWCFLSGKLLKLAITVVLVVAVTKLLQLAVFPFMIGYLLVVAVQVFSPALVSCHWSE